MIEFQKIKKSFKANFWSDPTEVLKDISFNINKGEMVGFLGANGAGKTTLIKIIMGFIKSDSGHVVFDKVTMGHTHKEQLSNIGYLPERPYFYPHLSGREFLNFLAELNKVSRALCEERIQIWAKRMKIDHALDRTINSYSKGMLQRLGFVSTLLHDPEFLILDEPLSGLDPVGRREFKDALLEINNLGKTVFFSSHIVGDVEELCSKVIVLEHGEIVYKGLIEELVRKHSLADYRVVIKCGADKISSGKHIHDLGEFAVYSIPEKEKAEFLNEVVDKNIDLVSMGQIQPSLEQIVYNIGNQNV